jgi:hypothetical protein
MSLLTVTEYLWQFYGRHHDFVNVTEKLSQILSNGKQSHGDDSKTDTNTQ